MSSRTIRVIGFCGMVGALLLCPSMMLGQTQSKTNLLKDDQCVKCHTEMDNLPEGYITDDVHAQPGLSCSGCHGGDPTKDDPDLAMSPDAGFIGVPSRQEIPHFCGRCHSDIDFMRKYQPRIDTDQESQYATSVHGQRLVKGDMKVAECASCHTAHGILPASDTRSTVHPFNVPSTCKRCHSDADYMKEYGIPTDQYAGFVKGVHGIALLQNQDTGAPACNDCHGNHGAVPPGISSVRQVCGHCHVNNMKFFEASRMGAAFQEAELHGCEECHGNHYIPKPGDFMVGTTDGAVCIKCHSEGDGGWKAAGAIRSMLDSLVVTYNNATAEQKIVQTIGMDDVDIGFLLQDSHQDLIKSRTLVHTFDPTKVRPTAYEGIKKSDEALVAARAQIKDYHIRRRGFGMATLFITILAIALFLKIRQMEGA